MSSGQGKGQVLWAFLLLPPSHFLLLTILQPPSLTAPVWAKNPAPAQASGVRKGISHSWGDWHKNKCLAPVTVSQQAQMRGFRCPLLLHWRLSPPALDSTACQHLKSFFCLCHFIFKTSFRLESLSNHLILQTNRERSAKFWLFPASSELSGNVTCRPVPWMWDISNKQYGWLQNLPHPCL